ncbi:hypothetical protein [Polaribacter atrinae]|uniref:Uncharacterized protein n=1 Tax=Polaribacter atrinae TaxID=1333662 RepID=A0A176SV78_9FLAO|nr:hypothetical protein [Polaribacter atrinae]OAD39590.1 hypothetical protein LPB303_17020 [Polaribacter atrinae]
MEGKIIIGIISAFILVITATFINSENLSKTQKNILFILILFPPAQWILGIIFLNLNKENSNQKFISKKRKNKKSKGKKNIKRKKNNEKKQLEKINSTKKKTKIIKTQNKKISVEKLTPQIALIKSKFKENRKLLRKELKMNLITDIEYEYKLKILKEKKEKELLE